MASFAPFEKIAVTMSDSDDMEFGAMQTSTSSLDEEEHPRKPTSRRAPLRKRPSLQKRKKPAKIQRHVSKVTDPFDDAALFKTSDTMDEEMNAMKQVFLRMSEKKLQQKEERKAECKRLYKEAFRAEVEQAFRKAAKTRSKAMDSVSGDIEDVKAKLKISNDHLQVAHGKYKEAFKVELAKAESEIEVLRSILLDLDSQYTTEQNSIDREYEEITQAMEESLQQLEVKLIEAYEDKSFLSSFRPQVERLL